MSDMIFTLTKDQLIEELNKAKELVLGALYNEEMITQENYNLFMKSFAITLQSKNVFGRAWDKFVGSPPEKSVSYRVIQNVPYGVSDSVLEEVTPPIKLVPKPLEIEDE